MSNGPFIVTGVDGEGNPLPPYDGEVIDSPWGRGSVERLVKRFSTETYRDTQLPTPDQGQLCYVRNVDELQIFDGTNWVTVVPDDVYLRLDDGNNNPTPNDYIRSAYVDDVFLPLSGGWLTGPLVMDQETNLLFDWIGGNGFNLRTSSAGDLQFRRGIISWMVLEQSSVEQVKFGRRVDLQGNDLRNVADPANAGAGMSRGYNDGRYSVLSHTHPPGDDVSGVLLDGAYTAADVTPTGTTSVLVSVTLAVQAGVPILVDAAGMLRSRGINGGDEFGGRIAIDGVLFDFADAGVPSASQASHNHSGPSHSHSSASHNHSSASHLHSTTIQHTHSITGGSTGSAGPGNTTSTTPGSTGSTTPGSTGSAGTGNTSTQTPNITVGATRQTVSPIALRKFTPSGTTITVELWGVIVTGTPSTFRASLKATAYTT